MCSWCRFLAIPSPTPSPYSFSGLSPSPFLRLLPRARRVWRPFAPGFRLGSARRVGLCAFCHDFAILPNANSTKRKNSPHAPETLPVVLFFTLQTFLIVCRAIRQLHYFILNKKKRVQAGSGAPPRALECLCWPAGLRAALRCYGFKFW